MHVRKDFQRNGGIWSLFVQLRTSSLKCNMLWYTSSKKSKHHILKTEKIMCINIHHEAYREKPYPGARSCLQSIIRTRSETKTTSTPSLIAIMYSSRWDQLSSVNIYQTSTHTTKHPLTPLYYLNCILLLTIYAFCWY